jgi:putative addiction module component (TIGR02574 family)
VSASFKHVVEQALDLTEDERGELAALLLRSLEPHDGEEITTLEWEAAWSAELARRLQEIRDGRVELVDGDEVLAELSEIANAPA